MPELILNDGASNEQIFEIQEGATLIGRAKDNNVVILDASLSRQHARIEGSAENYSITDLQSRNGTFVNGARVDQSVLKNGDRIQCGDVTLAFYMNRKILEETPVDLSHGSIKDLLLQDKEASKLSALRLKREDTAGRARDKFHLLLRIGELLSSPDEIETLLDRILDLLFQIVQAKRAVILLVDEETGKFVPRIVRPNVDPSDTRQLYSSHIVEHVRQKQVGVVSADTQADQRFGNADSIMMQSIRSSMCVPLKVRDQLIGVLYVDNTSLVRFGPEELEFVSGFANQAAIAIENSRLYKRLEEEAKNREKELVALVEERTRSLADAMIAAEEANRAKSRFLASMSHELRTPLNAIIGYSEMLEDELKDLDQKDLIPDLKKIEGAGKHLLALINDILDVSKIEAGKMELYLETFELSSLIREIATTIKPLVEKNANKLELVSSPDLGSIYADATRVRQVLFNLLSNACKFTKDGVITLRADRKVDNGAEWVSLIVRDTGIGMTSDQLGKLFQAFSQADSSISRRFGGTGLGLALSKRFCQMMGGDIDVESVYGKGTTFIAKFPAEVTAPHHTPTPNL